MLPGWVEPPRGPKASLSISFPEVENPLEGSKPSPAFGDQTLPSAPQSPLLESDMPDSPRLVSSMDLSNLSTHSLEHPLESQTTSLSSGENPVEPASGLATLLPSVSPSSQPQLLDGNDLPDPLKLLSREDPKDPTLEDTYEEDQSFHSTLSDPPDERTPARPLHITTGSQLLSYAEIFALEDLRLPDEEQEEVLSTDEVRQDNTEAEVRRHPRILAGMTSGSIIDGKRRQ
jgi:hypothetical protein